MVDSNNVLVKNVLLKGNVFSKNKHKSFQIRTNSYGVARIKTNDLSLGAHKLTVMTNDNRYVISKSSMIVVARSVPKRIGQLTAYAPVKVVKYKNNTYFGIEVKNNYGYPVKNILLKVNVFSGKKYASHYIRTDSRGVAKLGTNGLSLGTHAVVIKSANANYALSKVSGIIVNSYGTYNKYEPTKLASLNFYPAGGKYYAKLSWISKPKSTYQVMRKSNGCFGVIATVTASSGITSFTDRVKESDSYTYSVRQVITESKTERILGAYDCAGLKLIANPQVKVNVKNMGSEISWSKVSDATKYLIFRKIGREGQFKCIAIVDGNRLSYVDHYKLQPELSEMLTKHTFINPDSNNLVYTVRACNIKSIDAMNSKISYGLYLDDGDFHLETPSIVSLKNNKITWGTVQNADGYLIIKKQDSNGTWKIVGQADKQEGAVQSMDIGIIDNNAYYSVIAFANKNGARMYSGYDVGFSLKDFSENNSKYRILYLGDSITYGYPSSLISTTRHIFSIPYRVEQLTGSVCYNPSIPGSTYHSYGGNGADDAGRHHIILDIVDPMSAGNVPNWNSYFYASNNGRNTLNTSLDYYNVVVLAAGFNDYYTNARLGSYLSDDVTTFNGALNHILGKIENASRERVERGEEPIAVIFVDLYYATIINNNLKITNCDITPNEVGLTLSDYQYALDVQYMRWKSNSTYMTFYNFNTRSYGIGDGENWQSTLSDNVHFTRYAYTQYGNAFANFLLEEVFD